MIFKRGDLHLAKLYPQTGNEVGKTRPVLIYQTDLLNHVPHSTIIIIPLSTRLIDGAYPLRYRVSQRENLKQNSDLLCDQLRSIDPQRLNPNKIGSLSMFELLELDHQVKIILDLE